MEAGNKHIMQHYVLTEWCLSVLPIWYMLLMLGDSLVTEVWPDKLNVCSDSIVGKDNSWYLFYVSHQNICLQQALFSCLDLCFGSGTQ